MCGAVCPGLPAFMHMCMHAGVCAASCRPVLPCAQAARGGVRQRAARRAGRRRGAQHHLRGRRQRQRRHHAAQVRGSQQSAWILACSGHCTCASARLPRWPCFPASCSLQDPCQRSTAQVHTAHHQRITSISSTSLACSRSHHIAPPPLPACCCRHAQGIPAPHRAAARRPGSGPGGERGHSH